MKKIVTILILVLMVSILGIAPARADSHLNPTDDTYVDLNDPNPITPPGKNGYGLLSDYSYFPAFVVTRRVYLRFDLSTMSDDAYPGSLLRLHIIGAPFNTTGNLALWSTGDDWNGANAGNGDETTLTWNNAPAPITKIDTQPAGAVGTDIDFYSTALFSYIYNQRSANGGDDIASFMVQWDSCSSCGFFDNITFEDREDYGGSGKPPELILLGPTAILVSKFDATPNVVDIHVTWKTVIEDNLDGFNLFRSSDPDSKRIQLNESMIPALGLPIGWNYLFIDKAVRPGSTYYYWLQTVERSGKLTDYGPAQANTSYTLFLPFLKR